MKILIIRFSSIGDVVLTSPVIRCIKQQAKNAEVHFLVKEKFANTVVNNPYIDKLHTTSSSYTDVIPQLKKEKFDVVIDLQRNVRSLRIKMALGVKAYAFNKLNYKKWLLVNLKVNKMPPVHIVERYLQTAAELGVKDDGKGLDFFIAQKDEVEIKEKFPMQFHSAYNALVLGGSYFTKQIPTKKLTEIIEKSTLPLILLGGKEDSTTGEALQKKFPDKVYNAAGKFSLLQSASIIKQSSKVISSDTGLMHIAAAYGKTIISLWGNTVPEFGMYPYKPGPGSKMLEVKNLSCRPCSKLGYKKCPKGHFKCMNEITIEQI